MKFCPNCGKPLDERFEICANCGAVVSEYLQEKKGAAQPMSFGRAIKLYFKNYVKFSGRATRKEFWYPVLFQFLVVIGFAIIFGISAAIKSGGLLAVAMIAYCLFLLGTILPSISVTVRRLHDTGRSGKLLIWMYILSIAVYGISVGASNGPGSTGMAVLLLALSLAGLVFSIVVLVCECKASGPDNKYGEKPNY